MEFLKDSIKALVTDAVAKKFPGVSCEPKVEYPTQSTHGDYAVSVAFELAKKVKKSPAVVAGELKAAIQLPNWISKVEIAGAGFINFFLAPEFLTGFLSDLLKEGSRYGTSEAHKGETVVTDISHPNVAKPMGAHHLLSTIIGDALNRIFASVGYKVIRDNYLGDWGTQFGKLIFAYKKWGNEAVVKKDPIPELLKLYVKFHDEAEKTPGLDDEAREEFVMLEAGDPESRKLWKWVVELSLSEFHKIYGRLGVSFDYIHGESFYEDKMGAIVALGEKEKVFVKGERGALIAELEHKKMPPCIIKKSDGASTYATRDLARVKYWEDTWHPNLMVNVVDMAQQLHFQQFFEVARMLGLTKAPNVHVMFGRMRFPEKRMSTRKGNIILLEDLLDEAEEQTYAIVKEKNPELPETQKKEVAKLVGIGAVKYAVLAQNRLTDVTFTWEKLLSLEGNSAPYLQYVYARAKSIVRKGADAEAGAKGGGVKRDKAAHGKVSFKEPVEFELARLLPRFPEIIARAADEFNPHFIATYLFEVASKFNSFYAAVPVLQGEDSLRALRIQLVEATATVLKNGLALLGIESPEEM